MEFSEFAQSLYFIGFIYFLGLGLIFAELFVPGGILALIGSVLSITAVTMVFLKSPIAGGIMTAFTGVVVFLIVRFGLNRLTHGDIQDSSFGAADPSLSELVGKTGTAITMLRPAGDATIDGRRVDVVTEGDIVEKGQTVEVIKVEGSRIVVREVSK